MTLPSAKELKQLAKACRAAGITSFEGGGVKFTLGDIPQPKLANKESKPTVKQGLGENTIESDELSPETLLFWSTRGDKEEEGASA